MKMSNEIRQWAEQSEHVADAIDKHINDLPGRDDFDMDGKRIVAYLGTRCTVISGFVNPEEAMQFLNGKESTDKGLAADEHSPVTPADCRKRFADTENMPFGGFPMPKRKLRIDISGLHDLKNGIVTGAEVEVGIWQQNKLIHCEVFSGKATQPFSRDVEVHASFGEIVVTHNRPDLKDLKVSAEFNDAEDSAENVNSLANIINKHIRERLEKELQPGGLLYRR